MTSRQTDKVSPAIIADINMVGSENAYRNSIHIEGLGTVDTTTGELTQTPNEIYERALAFETITDSQSRQYLRRLQDSTELMRTRKTSIAHGSIERLLTRGIWGSVQDSPSDEPDRRWIGRDMIHRTRNLYPKTWVDRIIALVMSLAIPGQESACMTALQPLFIAAVTDTLPRYGMQGARRRNRDSSALDKALTDLLAERRQSSGKQLQGRQVKKIKWMIAYLLDRCNRNACRCAMRDVVREGEGIIGSSTSAVSRVMDWVTAGHKDCILPVFEVIKSKPGYPGGEASTFVLTEEFRHLLELAEDQKTTEHIKLCCDALRVALTEESEAGCEVIAMFQDADARIEGWVIYSAFKQLCEEGVAVNESGYWRLAA